MSCASCVTRVERALASVPGVTRARVNLAERSTLVMRSPASHALLAAVQQAGYGTEVFQDEDERRCRQQQTAERATRRYSRQSVLARLLDLTLPSARVVVAIALASTALWWVASRTGTAQHCLFAGGRHDGTHHCLPLRAGPGNANVHYCAVEFGVLVRDADALQQASQIDTLVFDKTGTPTEGWPKVVAIEPFSGWESQAALMLAAAIEQGSGHPLAHAFRARNKKMTRRR